MDVRALGSGTAGARNVFRVADKTTAAATLAIDAAKGALAVWLASRLAHQSWAEGAAFAAVVAGHIWPAQLSFRGGKGAGTGLGSMLAIDPLAALIAMVAGLAVGVVSRSLTVGGLTAVALAAPAAAIVGHPLSSVAAIAVACLLILVAHHPSFERGRPPVMRAQESTP